MVDSTKDEVELPLLATPRVPSHLVSDSLGLRQAISEIASSRGPIAIDAERASGFKYSQRAYLIQLRSSGGDIYLLDPLTLSEATKEQRELSAVLADREWILHAATQDLPCLAELNLKPGAIFDTELAARLAGLPRVGLGSLTESLLNFKLAKEHSAADWSTRPLPESWLNYAALDVDVLHELQVAMTDTLNAQNKAAWASQEFEHLLSFQPKPQREERWRGLSGISKITDRSVLEIARRLHIAREELAMKLDVAPGRLIPDVSILAAAEAKPKSRSELIAMRNFHGRASRNYIDVWWEAVSLGLRATELPELRPKRIEGVPNHRSWPNKFPEAAQRLSDVKVQLEALSKEHQVPLENLLTPDLVRQLAFNPPAEVSEISIAKELKRMNAREWQISLTARAIAEAFIRSSLPQPAMEVATPQE
ncbi:MAG: HRDC domain-containing protein [Actinomycetota bacterium]